MSQFYLTLPSNSSMDRFPQNKTSEYTTALSRRIDLDEDYEVALVEASFPFTFVHFPNYEENVTTVYKSGRQRIAPIPKRYYVSAMDLLFHMRKVIPQGLNMGLDSSSYVTITYKQENLNRFSMYPKDDVVSVTATPLLAAMLGLESTNLLQSTDFRGAVKTNLFIGLPTLMFYYCDIVEEQSVGDTVAPFLRTVNPNAAVCAYGAVCTTSFVRPFYVPVLKRRFDTVDILIKDAMGRNVSFSQGTSCCTLHFRPKRYV